MASLSKVPSVGEKVSQTHAKPSSQSSDSGSDDALFNEKELVQLDHQHISGPTYERYAFNFPLLFSRGLIISRVQAAGHEASSSPKSSYVYYAEVSEFTMKKADITLHSYASTGLDDVAPEKVADIGANSPIIGVAFGPKFSRGIRLGLGSSDMGEPACWVDLVNPNKSHHGEHRFSWRDKLYAWKRTRDPGAGVEGGKVKRIFTKDSFQLIDMSTNEVLGVFLQDKWGSLNKRGELRVFRDLDLIENDKNENTTQGSSLRVVAFLSLAIILELSRRRSWQRKMPKGASGG